MGGLTRPTVSDAQAWQPNSLREAADSWQAAATDVHADIEIAVQGVASNQEVWTGSAAEAARGEALALGRASDALARAMVMAAVAARDGADQITAARDRVLDLVSAAQSEGFAVADDGTVSMDDDPTPLLVALSGGDAGMARDLLASRADVLTRQIGDALDRLGAADADAAGDVEEAFDTPASRVPATVPAGVRPSGGVVADWPTMSQDRIADQIVSMSPEQRQRLVAEFPRQVGNTDGVPYMYLRGKD